MATDKLDPHALLAKMAVEEVGLTMKYEFGTQLWACQIMLRLAVQSSALLIYWSLVRIQHVLPPTFGTN